jgi:threonine aldolase
VFFDIGATGMTVPRLQEKLAMQGIWVSGMGNRVRACLHLDVTTPMVEDAVGAIRTALAAA